MATEAGGAPDIRSAEVSGLVRAPNWRPTASPVFRIPYSVQHGMKHEKQSNGEKNGSVWCEQSGIPRLDFLSGTRISTCYLAFQ